MDQCSDMYPRGFSGMERVCYGTYPQIFTYHWIILITCTTVLTEVGGQWPGVIASPCCYYLEWGDQVWKRDIRVNRLQFNQQVTQEKQKNC